MLTVPAHGVFAQPPKQPRARRVRSERACGGRLGVAAACAARRRLERAQARACAAERRVIAEAQPLAGSERRRACRGLPAVRG